MIYLDKKDLVRMIRESFKDEFHSLFTTQRTMLIVPVIVICIYGLVSTVLVSGAPIQSQLNQASQSTRTATATEQQSIDSWNQTAQACVAACKGAQSQQAASLAEACSKARADSQKVDNVKEESQQMVCLSAVDALQKVAAKTQELTVQIQTNTQILNSAKKLDKP